MSSGSSFLDGLGGFDLAGLLEQLRQAPQGFDPSAAMPAPTGGLSPFLPPVQPVRGAGDTTPSGHEIGSIDQRRPSIAMNEDQAQALERAQAGPQDLAALGAPRGSPDALLFDRASLGGSGGFTGTADPFGSRSVPLPPSRPSDADLMPSPTATGSVQSPPGPTARSNAVPAVPVTAADTGNPAASNLQPVNSFDPLTGQLVSGSPKLMQAPGMGGPTAGGGQASQGGAYQPGNLMEQFAKRLNNPDVSNLLLNVGIGLLTHRGIPEGIGAGLSGYQQSRTGDLKQQLQMLQVQQQLQSQNATRAALKAKGVAPEMIEAAALNPTVLSNVFSQLNQKTPEQIAADAQASAMGARMGGPQLADKVAEADALAGVKDAHAKDDIVLQPDGQGGTIAVRKSSLFPDKASGAAAGEGGAPSNAGGDPNVRTIIPPQPDKKANEGLDKLIGDNITGGYQKAQGAVGTLAAISRQKEALDKGVIAGAGADWRTQAQAIGAQMLGIDPSQLNATYNFDAASTQKQAELAKAVSQAGHTTNMDLQLGKTIAGGDRSKTEQALRQIVDAQEQLARDAIDRHNAALDKYAKIAPEAAARTGFFKVETPEVYKYGQGTPNPLADPGARLPTNAPAPLDVGGSRQFQGITIKRVR